MIKYLFSKLFSYQTFALRTLLIFCLTICLQSSAYEDPILKQTIEGDWIKVYPVIEAEPVSLYLEKVKEQQALNFEEGYPDYEIRKVFYVQFAPSKQIQEINPRNYRHLLRDKITDLSIPLEYRNIEPIIRRINAPR